MYEAFIDLDELIIRCRDKSSRKFIQESVACYRAGAFRSCIIATWNAVVFDFLHKLRELELLGDGEASQLLKRFEQLSSEKKVRELWQFESDIPEIALTKFELISPVEKSDIERLFEDRSRCAHPSMTSLEEPFEATAELARYHLRSAVTHLLQHPPVQGRAARTRIFQDIKSENFPIDPQQAIKHFHSSPLVRARFSLIKDVVLGLTVSLLTDDFSEEERERQFSALTAVATMHSKETGEILNAYLSDIILNKVVDSNWEKVIIYLSKITAWEKLSEACQIKAKIFIERIEVIEIQQKYFRKLSQRGINLLIQASHVDFLRTTIIEKLKIPLKNLLLLKETCKDDIFREKILFPLFKALSPQATLDELILIRSITSIASDKTVNDSLKDKIQSASLEELILIISSCNDQLLVEMIEPVLEEKISEIGLEDLEDLLAAKLKYRTIKEPKDKILSLFDSTISKRVEEASDNLWIEGITSLLAEYKDEFFVNLVEPILEEIIPSSGLGELLKSKEEYIKIESPKDKLIEIFNESITKEVSSISFEELFKLSESWDAIPDELLSSILKNNVSEIIDKFVNSSSFDSAGNNTALLLRIVEYLNLMQWEEILEAFFKNSQLYCSYRCIGNLELLFKKSLELDQAVQPYWIAFREKLNRINSKSKYINSLKGLIDSYV